MGKLFDDYSVEPLGNFVLLKREEAKETTESGLILPMQSQGKSLQAKVLAVGPGTYINNSFVPTTVKVGDVVMLDTIAGFEIEDCGQKLVVVRETEIIAIVRSK